VSEGGFHPAVAAAGLARLARPPPGLEAATAAGVLGGEGEGGEGEGGGGRPGSGRGEGGGAGGGGPRATTGAPTLEAALAAGTLPPLHPPTLALDPDAIRLHAALKLFSRTPRWAAGVFEGEWGAALPPGVGVGDARAAAWRALAGEAILDGPAGPGTNGAPTPLLPGARPARVTHFPSAALPADPGARAAALFAARPRWTLASISPFLAPLVVAGSGGGGAGGGKAGGGRTLAGMLLAHARASAGEGGGPTLYSAR